MGWIDAELLLRQVNREEDEWYLSRDRSQDEPEPPDLDPGPVLLTVAEVAELLGVNDKRVRHMVSQRRFEGVTQVTRHGKPIHLIPEPSVLALCASHPAFVGHELQEKEVAQHG